MDFKDTTYKIRKELHRTQKQFTKVNALCVCTGYLPFCFV